MPSVNGPILIPMLVLNTGSVRIVKPSMLSSSVLWPIQAACNPSFGQAEIRGTRGDGSTERFRSSDSRCQKIGPARTANSASALAFRTGVVIVAMDLFDWTHYGAAGFGKLI